MYKVGDQVIVVDLVDDTKYQEGKVVFVELDDEYAVVWIYILADNPALNNEYDARFGNYWVVRESDSKHLYLK